MSTVKISNGESPIPDHALSDSHQVGPLASMGSGPGWLSENLTLTHPSPPALPFIVRVFIMWGLGYGLVSMMTGMSAHQCP